MGVLKFKIFCFSKGNVKKKNKVTDREEMLTIRIFDKNLNPEYLKNSSNLIRQLKWAKDWNRHFTREYMQMTVST